MSSWLSSLFSSFRIPPPADSIRPDTTHRILEVQQPQQPGTATQSTTRKLSTPQDALLSEPTTVDAATPRANRNKVIFGAGVGFFVLSVLITRRSFARRRLASLSNTLPSGPANSSSAGFYAGAPQHAEQAGQKVSGAMEAVEALNIATINVLSVAMMATGGALWYFDINSMQEARRFIRGGLGVDGTGMSEKDAEEEFEEWMATTLARKEDKEKARAVR